MEGGGRGLGGGLGCRSGDGDPVWDELAHTQGNVDGGGAVAFLVAALPNAAHASVP